VCAPSGSNRAAAETGRESFEVADVVRAHGAELRATHRLAPVQVQALRAIEACRTQVLGGRREVCDGCGKERRAWNSCRNRHCPKCQSLSQARWAEERKAELLPVEHFQVVFTLPHDLNPLAQGNPGLIYDLLFRSVSDTLLTFGRDPKHLGGETGFTAVLHTWGQTLDQHLHLHCIVPGGALSPDGSEFRLARPHFLFPVEALSPIFREKFLEGLRDAFDGKKLRFARGTENLADPETFAAFLKTLKRHEWVVYANGSSSGAGSLVDYLARYTQKVAIGNERIVGVRDGIVRFRYRDYSDGSRSKVMELPAVEFLRRFLLHVLPRGFVRIRHYGFLANRHRRRKLDRALALLHQPPLPPPVPAESAADLFRRLTGTDPALCPFCRKGHMRVVEFLPPLHRPASPVPLNSS